jgi:glucuronate isomerase
MHRFFDQVMEAAGINNTVGFNDDTRAFPSIPARHDLLWRAACDWVAGLLVRHLIDAEDAKEMAYELVYGLAKKVFTLDESKRELEEPESAKVILSTSKCISSHL